jgi:hypothetical protein
MDSFSGKKNIEAVRAAFISSTSEGSGYLRREGAHLG